MKGMVYRSCVTSAMLNCSMVLDRKRDGNFENRKSNDLRDVRCEAIRSKKQRGIDGHVGYKKVFGIRVARVFSWRRGGPNRKSHAIMPSKIFEEELFMGQRHRNMEDHKPWACFGTEPEFCEKEKT